MYLSQHLLALAHALLPRERKKGLVGAGDRGNSVWER